MTQTATGTASRPCHTSLRSRPGPLAPVLSPRSSRPGPLAPALSPRPSRPGPLAPALSPWPSLALAKALLLMSLAFLTLVLPCARPAQAQTPGYWVFDHSECAGTDNGSGGRFMGGPWPPITWAPSTTGNPIFDSYGDAESSSIDVTITPFFLWVPGGDPNAKPTTLRAKIKSEAYAGDQNGAQVSADNGFKDVSSQFPRGYVFYSDSDAASVGTHLEQMDPQGKTLVSLPPQTLSVSGGLCEDYQSISSEVDYTASTDPRSVAIGSTLEPTWHKDPTTGLPAQNVRTAIGFMVADTLAPDSSSTLQVTYSPIYDRSLWGNSSQYLWHSNDYPPDASGMFNTFLNYNVPSPSVNYSSPTITPGSNDYITLTLTDSTDGAVAKNNYSVLFHDYYEQWTRTATKNHPGALNNPDGTLNTTDTAEWQYLTSVECPGSVAQTQHLNQAYSDSITETGTIGTQGSLTAPGVAALQRNGNITNGETVTGTVTTSYDFPGMPYARISYYVAKTYEERWGTTDAYLGNGFQGTENWYAISVTNPMVLSTAYHVDSTFPH